MHKIQQLIQELCPDGVEFKKIGEVVKKTSNIRWADNQGDEFKYIDLTSVDRATRSIVSTQIIDSETAPSRAQQLVQEGDVIFGTTRPLLKRYTVIPKGYEGQICSTGFCVLRPDQSCILTNYLFHLLGTDDFYQYVESNEQGASYPAISDSAIKKFPIPIPPLPIQNEIVHILDLFTQLEAELEAELEGRKMQYTYYRDTLLNFEGKDVEWKKLSELCKIGDGLHGTPVYNITGSYHFINGNNLSNGKLTFDNKTKKVDDVMYKKHGISFSDEKTIFMSINGTIGSLAYFNNEKIVLGKSVAYFNILSNFLSKKFLFYFLQTDYSLKYFETSKTGSTIKNLGLKALREFEIPLPTIDEQERIANMIEKFDAFTNDLSSGLPAEIQARRQQYEYYRNQLLTFKNRDHG